MSSLKKAADIILRTMDIAEQDIRRCELIDSEKAKTISLNEWDELQALQYLFKRRNCAQVETYEEWEKFTVEEGYKPDGDIAWAYQQLKIDRLRKTIKELQEKLA